MKKNLILLFSEKFKLFWKLQKNWNGVSLYLEKLPMLYGIKIKIYFKIYKCIKTDWIWRYDLYPRSFSSRDKKGVNLIFFSKNKYLDFFLLLLITIYPNWSKNIINTIKDVLVSNKPKFSYNFIIFLWNKMQISLLSEKFKLFLILQKTGIVFYYIFKKLPILYGIKIKIFFLIYKYIKTDWIWCYRRTFSCRDKK